ncbi:hypothetical protein GYA19_02685 [Candidatus Beckwithbacteria bacterium]|nr:hypothetical protein [Candidatus Beckwithbacteria bacterium]
MPIGEGEPDFVCPIKRDYCIVISSPEYDSDATLTDPQETNCHMLEVKPNDGSFCKVICKVNRERIPLKQLYRINKPKE